MSKCEEDLKALGYRSYNFNDLVKQMNYLENFYSETIRPNTLTKIAVMAHYLEIVGKNIFKLYDNPDEVIDRQARCSMIYLSMALDSLSLVFDNIASQKQENKN